MATGSSTTDLTWLPTDYEEQLSLGFRIISNAHKNRVQSLEAENRNMRHQIEEKNQQLAALQKKHSSLEVELIETHQRASRLLDENRNLIQTTRKLHKDIQRLESLKQAVLSSIQDNNNDEDTIKVYNAADYLQTAAPLSMQELTTGQSPPSDTLLTYSKTPDFLPSPAGTGTASGLSAVDGKAFFRTARGRLSYEQFNTFLNEIKKLNEGVQTRDDTLNHVKDIFGKPHHDLFEDFGKLLNHHR